MWGAQQDYDGDLDVDFPSVMDFIEFEGRQRKFGDRSIDFKNIRNITIAARVMRLLFRLYMDLKNICS